jgi:hypothetical protein
MLPWELLPVIFSHMVVALFQPLFWLIVGFITYQHWQMQKTQIRMFGGAKYTLQKIVTHAIGFGLLGGFLGSLLLVVVGITINNMGLEYVWMVALGLALIHMRYLCFAYAGGFVCISSLVFGWPQVHVPGLIALVAILHITESVLIALSGSSGAIPLVMRTQQGDMVGGFHLLNFWPLPLMLLQSTIIEKSVITSGVLHMPDWWPLIRPAVDIQLGQMWLYGTTTVVAALGYADMAMVSHPSVRRRQSSKHLFMYSSLLLIAAIAANRYPVLQIIAALLAPVGHEYLIWLDNKRERAGRPLFQPVSDGVMVLDTMSGTPADKLRLKPGDVIQRVNGVPVYNRADIAAALTHNSERFDLHIKTVGGVVQRRGYLKEGSRIGVITVPEGYETYYIDVQQDAAFDVIKRFIGRFKKNST